MRPRRIRPPRVPSDLVPSLSSKTPVLKPMEDRKRGELSHERIKGAFIHRIESQEACDRHRFVLHKTIGRKNDRPDSQIVLCVQELSPRQRVVCNKTLKEACLWRVVISAMCVQRFDDSLNSAIRITYRISLRSSSLREPRYPLLTVV